MAAVVGPALGGLALGIWHEAATVYLIDAACGLTVLGLFGAVAEPPRLRGHEPFSWDSLLAGLRFVRNTELILATITLDMLAVLLGGAVMLLPVFARDILRVGPEGLGWLRAAPSVGALAMAILLAHRPPLRRAGRDLLLAVAGFGLATIVFGLSRNFWLSLAMLALTGAFDNVSVVVRGTLVQVLTPDELRGRVSSVKSVFIGTSNELGGFESGLAARLFGPVVAVVAGGVGTILVVLAVARKWPSVRRLGSLMEAGRAVEVSASHPVVVPVSDPA
jgi:MFS family permease